MSDNTLHTYTLPRDGARPVRFTGTLVTDSKGAWVRGKDQNRYYNLALYQLENRRWLVAWDYITRWQGESNHHQMATYITLDEAIAALEGFDCCAWVVGYKPTLARLHPDHGTYAPNGSAHSMYTARQADLERSIAAHYRAQVSEICASLDIAEEL